MYLVYSLLYSFAFILLSPLFLLRREKYAAGFSERLGNYLEFKKDERPVIWLHCVSVGETNAARPLVDQILTAFPDYRLVFSTTTRTGQALANKIFENKAEAVFYFPFDWKFTVQRALKHFRPSVVLMMETEIWPRFFREAHEFGVKLAIVNGRLSEKSFRRYSRVQIFVQTVLAFVDLALMQGEKDADRLIALGFDRTNAKITGNLKFDLAADESESQLTEEFRQRFGIDGGRPLIVAASTHEPEESWVLDALETSGYPFRVVFAPRHPERFATVANMLGETQYSLARRSNYATESDKTADLILLDSIGELRAVFPLADIVFVGGSFIPHGGQSVLEPANVGKAIVVGPFTHNFEAVINGFLEQNALIQAKAPSPEHNEPWELYCALRFFLDEPDKRAEYGERALQVMKSSRGATLKTIEQLAPLLRKKLTLQAKILDIGYNE